MVVQHSVRASLGERLYVQASLHDYFSNLLHPQVSPKASDFDCFPKGLCVSPCVNIGLHVRWGTWYQSLILCGYEAAHEGYNIGALFQEVMCSSLTPCLFPIFIEPTCKPKKGWLCLFAYEPVRLSACRLHVREGVKKYNIHCGPKSYKLKLLEKLVIQQLWIITKEVSCVGHSLNKACDIIDIFIDFVSYR